MTGLLTLGGIMVQLFSTELAWNTLHRELGAIAATLEGALGPALNEPGQLSAAAQRVLPQFCSHGQGCLADSGHTPHPNGKHQLELYQTSGYFSRLTDLSGRVLSESGQNPAHGNRVPVQPLWQTLGDRRGQRFHLVSLMLWQPDGRPWGYLQLGRSIQDLDQQLARQGGILLSLWPLMVLATGWLGWQLAGLALGPALRAYQQMEQFTADAAHELRTPLAAMRATLDLEDPQNPMVTVLQRQLQRLIQLANDLLLLNRLEQGSVPVLAISPLNEVLSDVVEDLSPLAHTQAITLNLVQPTQTIWVAGDADRLLRLFANLVSNGIRYSPPNSRITVTLSDPARWAIVTITDQGIGLAEADCERIFERFYRVDTARSRQAGGSGLGLAIARAIARQSGGDISVSSRLGQGSTFTVRLPRMDAEITHSSNKTALQLTQP
jgi:signal transduction histidine kinase